MKIFVYGNEEQQNEIKTGLVAGKLFFNCKNRLPENAEYKDHDAFLILSDFSGETDFTLFQNTFHIRYSLLQKSSFLLKKLLFLPHD